MDHQQERMLIECIQKTRCAKSSRRLIDELRLYPRIGGFVRRYLRNPTDVEELTQEILAQTFCNIHLFDPQRGRFQTWLMGIALHKVYDWLRYHGRRRTEEEGEPMCDALTPEDILYRLELQVLLMEALEDLKERYRRILVSYYVKGCSHQEIAAHEGLQLNNIGTILNRSRRYWCASFQARLTRKHGQVRTTFSKEADAFAAMLPAMTARCFS